MFRRSSVRIQFGKFITSDHTVQCDQIGQFLKVLAQTLGDFLGFLKTFFNWVQTVRFLRATLG